MKISSCVSKEIPFYFHLFSVVQDLPPLSEPAPAVGTIRVDTKMRKVQFVDDVAVVLMDGSETRQIMFKGPSKRVFIDDMVSGPFSLD